MGYEIIPFSKCLIPSGSRDTYARTAAVIRPQNMSADYVPHLGLPEVQTRARYAEQERNRWISTGDRGKICR